MPGCLDFFDRSCEGGWYAETWPLDEPRDSLTLHGQEEGALERVLSWVEAAAAGETPGECISRSDRTAIERALDARWNETHPDGPPPNVDGNDFWWFIQYEARHYHLQIIPGGDG